MTEQKFLPARSLAAPVVTLMFIAVIEFAFHGIVSTPLFLLAVPLLLLTVLAAVDHAELVAHRIGQPFGSIILTLSVTVIEVALIVSVLLSDSEGDGTVARDTVFAAIMIVMNGIVGVCLLTGGIRYHQQGFQVRGATAALGVLGTLAALGLILPSYTLAEPGPVYNPTQLTFVAAMSLILYGLFLFVQTVSHRADFLDTIAAEHHDAAAPPQRVFVVAILMLLLALLAVVLLAELLSDPVRSVIEDAGLPEAMVGVAIALIVLLPEGITSIRAASENRLQTSLNLALGSALASLCLTIPTVALISVAMGRTLILGLDPEHIVLLVLTLFMSTLSLATGRTTIMQGGIHLVIFGAFLTISAVP
ncbi:calcium:proton antiporter [Limibaculum sp. M0105]|uniref:Calcium:proton antiporter n=1 Tax=Thermohalobaculum xanthum TaxID=2753746 RepID=A0A8J7M8Y8_9RHOB|nr:calcium:proton antiporter [Thermohalobaculum xanthum]MBK0400506.1 calcium:proton antiporter [Thermohalobaculum xanthum]